MAYGQIGTDSIVASTGQTFSPASSAATMKNRIINGAMTIDQRNIGASVTPTGAQYTVDRWGVFATQSSKFSIQQNAGTVTPPVGFINYLGVTSLSAYNLLSTDYFGIYQPIEGYNIADLAWGTANAKTVTLSFWVRSSLTGTFSGSIRNDGSSRCYPFTYTISQTNTWEQKSIVIPGDTTGTWQINNGVGMYVSLNLGIGSNYNGTAGAWTGTSNTLGATGATNVLGTNGATFYFTGVQLEVGNTTSSFDFRGYASEFALCCRYWQQFPNGGTGVGNNSGASAIALWVASSTGGSTRIYLPYSMRTAGSASYVGTLGAGGNGRISVLWNGDWATINSFSVTECTYESFRANAGLSGVSGNACAGLYFYQTTQTNVRVMIDAEL